MRCRNDHFTNVKTNLINIWKVKNLLVFVQNETEERPFDKLVRRQFFKLTLLSLFRSDVMTLMMTQWPQFDRMKKWWIFIFDVSPFFAQCNVAAVRQNFWPYQTCSGILFLLHFFQIYFLFFAWRCDDTVAVWQNFRLLKNY